MKKFERVQENKKGNIIVENKKAIIGFVVGLGIGLLLMAVLWPDRIAKLKNGEEPVVTLRGMEITADDFYNKLKESYTLESIVDLIDSYILNDKYDLDEEAKKYAEETSKNVFTQYEAYYGYSKEDFLASEGFKDEADFMEYLKVGYLYDTYVEEYVSSKVEDDEINDFYKDNVIGERKVILFSSIKEENTLENVRSALKKGTSLNTIKKNNGDITVNELTVTYEDYFNYSKDIWKQIKNLKEKEYSNIIDDSSLGSVVVYVTSTSNKPNLKDIKDNILDLIVQEKLSNDKTLYDKALISLRESYDIDFKDTVVKKAYEDYIKDYK